MIFKKKIDLRDMAKSVKESEYTKGSNVFAIAPHRSADEKGTFGNQFSSTMGWTVCVV